MYDKLQENLGFDFKCLSITLSPTPAFYLERKKEERSLGATTRRKCSLDQCPPPEDLIEGPLTACEFILRRCGQIQPLVFTECYPQTLLKNCFKVGEGVYGEVFLFRNADKIPVVMKIIPIEGTRMVNKERQKTFEEIISEVIVAIELSNLRYGHLNKTTGFAAVHNIKCVQGRYPDRLLDLWDIYDEQHASQNDSPYMFDPDQLYIVLELAYGGNDMEAFAFEDSEQALSLMKQTVCAVAVAESELEFEHRDLHWGNILISKTDADKQITYCIDGKEIIVPSCGVESSIIDFTLSRITYKNIAIYNNLANDPEIFNALGDYQFDVYRMMQDRIGNNWQQFEPYTNILWLHYILDKMINVLHYKYNTTSAHQKGIIELCKLQDRVLNYHSVKNFLFGEFVKVI